MSIVLLAKLQASVNQTLGNSPPCDWQVPGPESNCFEVVSFDSDSDSVLILILILISDLI